MKNRIYTLLLLYFAAQSAVQAQQDIPLPGLVVRQNSRVKTGRLEYLSNVNIQATQASPTRSDARGQFTLVFADKPAFNVTRIFAEKSGMEVVNKTDLERAAVLGRLEKLKIVMCPVGELMENQMAYYDIAEEAIVRRFKKRIDTLEAANTGLDNMITEINKEFNLDLKTKTEAIYALEKEWSKALVFAQETAQKFAAINLDDADSLYRQADAVFKKGDFEGVLELLRYDLLDKNIRNIRSNLNAADSLSAEGRSRIARGQENLRQTIQNTIFAARVAALDGAWKRAEEYYDLAVMGDKKDLAVIYEAANFMHQQNNFIKAKNYYKDALTITRELALKDPSKYLHNLAKLQNDMGVLFISTKEMDVSRELLEESLNIYIQLAKKNPEHFLYELSVCLNNIGIFFLDNDLFLEARNSFEESIRNIKILIQESNENIYLLELIRALNNLGVLFNRNKEFENSKSSFEEVLKISTQLVDKTEDFQYLNGISKTLNNLGNVLMANKEFNYAIQIYEEALIIKRKLADINPDRFWPDLAMTLSNLGILINKDTGNFSTISDKRQKVQEVYEEALNIRRKLVENDRDVYSPDLVAILINIGGFYADQDTSVAITYYQEASQILEQLIERNPKLFLPDLSVVFNDLGVMYLKNGNNNDGKKWLNEALKIRRSLYENEPNIYSEYLANTLSNFSISVDNLGDIVEAKKTLNEAIEIYRKLAEVNPNAFLPDLAGSLSRMGTILIKTTDSLGASRFYEEALIIYRELSEMDSFRYNDDIAITEFLISISYKNLVDRFDFLTEQNINEKKFHRRVLREVEIIKLIDQFEIILPGSDNIIRMNATSHGNLSWYQLFDKKFIAAERSARIGLAKYPAEEWIHTNLALALLYQGKWEEAKEIYTKLKDKPYGEGTYKATFLEDLDALEKEGITHPDVAKVRKLLGGK